MKTSFSKGDVKEKLHSVIQWNISEVGWDESTKSVSDLSMASVEPIQPMLSDWMLNALRFLQFAIVIQCAIEIAYDVHYFRSIRNNWLFYKLVVALFSIQLVWIVISIRADQLAQGYRFSIGMLWQFIRSVPVAMLYTCIPSTLVGLMKWRKVPLADEAPFYGIAGFWHSALLWGAAHRYEPGEKKKDARSDFFANLVADKERRVFGGVCLAYGVDAIIMPFTHIVILVIVSVLLSMIVSIPTSVFFGVYFLSLASVFVGIKYKEVVWFPYAVGKFRRNESAGVDSIMSKDIERADVDKLWRSIKIKQVTGLIVYGAIYLLGIGFLLFFTKPVPWAISISTDYLKSVIDGSNLNSGSARYFRNIAFIIAPVVQLIIHYLVSLASSKNQK